MIDQLDELILSEFSDHWIINYYRWL